MSPRLIALALVCIPLIANVQAETVACPDLAAAVQVGSCPSEEDLKYTFLGYCSDNARMYETDDTCADYQRYRRLKNVTLWEAGGGAFHAYLSCELSPAAIKAARASKIAVTRQDGITRVSCTYPDGIAFTHRTKGDCKVPGDGDCSTGPSACRATCD